MAGDDRDGVKTTRTSFELLELIRRRGSARVDQLAEEVGLASSTVHRHLATLERYGYVRRYGDSFRLGLKFLDFSEHVRGQWPLDAISGAVSDLSERTEEEVDFFAEDRGLVITLDRTFRKYHRLVRYGREAGADAASESRSQVGNYYHMHLLGAGKAILAAYPDDRVDRIIERRGLPAGTEHSITDRTELRAELERIRERGYAVDDEEYALGLRTVGTVVRNPNGGVFGALNVAGPKYRMQGVVLREEIPRALAAASDELEAQIADGDALVQHQPLESF